MVKRIVIAGSRSYNNYDEAKTYIDECLMSINREYTIVIISGGAVGADALGERYATEHGLEFEKYHANWSKYGKKAGPIRNRQMAEICDIAVCFWDRKSRGTKSLIDCVKKLGKDVYIKII